MENIPQIIGYGSYIPKYRIKKDEYIKVWGHFSGKIDEKSVIGYDEDAITMAVEAGLNALKNSKINKKEISFIAVGSTSSPYSVKSMASEIAMALGLPMDISLLDFKESEKAGTTALTTGLDLIRIKGGYGLIIGSDAPVASPGGSLDHTQAAGAAALVIGIDNTGIAEIEGYTSSNVEFIADKFKKEGSKFMQDLEIASYSNYSYTNSIKKASNELLEKLNLSLDVFDKFFIQGKDAREPTRIFRNIEKGKIQTTLINKIGDTGAASVILGLISIIYNNFSENSRILCCSYGSGAGSDVFSVKMRNRQETKKGVPTIEQYLNRKEYISYDQYLKFKNLIDLE